MTATVRLLPRSLAPLAGESLVGYLLRLAHRLDLSPARVAVLTGLADAHRPSIPASRLLALTPDHAATFARATHLSTAEVTALTLISFADRYPPVNPAFSGRQRQNHGVFVKENWVFSRASRYCPDCLAGDSSPIQDQYGGAWKLTWRLPVVFACPLHRRLLRPHLPRLRPARPPSRHRPGPTADATRQRRSASCPLPQLRHDHAHDPRRAHLPNPTRRSIAPGPASPVTASSSVSKRVCLPCSSRTRRRRSPAPDSPPAPHVTSLTYA